MVLAKTPSKKKLKINEAVTSLLEHGTSIAVFKGLDYAVGTFVWRHWDVLWATDASIARLSANRETTDFNVILGTRLTRLEFLQQKKTSFT